MKDTIKSHLDKSLKEANRIQSRLMKIRFANVTEKLGLDIYAINRINNCCGDIKADIAALLEGGE